MTTESMEGLWKGVRAAVAPMKRDAVMLDRLAETLSRSDGYESLAKIERMLDQLDGATALDPAVLERARAAAAPTREWLHAEWDRRGREVVTEVADCFLGRGVPVAIDGARLVAGPFGILIEATRDQGTIEFLGETVAGPIPLVPQRIFAAYESARVGLQRGETPPETMADPFIIAADAVSRRRNDGKTGMRVLLPELHFELFIARQSVHGRNNPSKSKLKEYSRAQFCWDLGRLREATHFLTRGTRVIELFPALAAAAKNRTTSVAVVAAGGSVLMLGETRVGP